MSFKKQLLTLLLFVAVTHAQAIPRLHVEGRYLKDTHGNTVLLHGFAQTFSPWFNERGTKWDNYDVDGCLDYNKGIIDGILAAGWKMDFVRMHMDPYWSNTPGKPVTGENDISAFDFERFKLYLDRVFIPMAEYAIDKGLYVIMRPPGVCPEKIQVGDDYQQYLLKVWEYVCQRPRLKDNPGILYELANEPVSIVDAQGSAAGIKELKAYLQPIVNKIRANCSNIVLIPGLSWQSQYAGFADYPIEGTNVGYAVHCYPGWYNGGHDENNEVVVNYEDFKNGWEAQISPVAAFAPIVVTEMDWAPVKYDSSWGKSTTGVAGATGFGANFKKIADDTGNVSWLLFTSGELLAQYDASAPDGQTFLTDPEACPRPCYQWYGEYAKSDYARPDFVWQPIGDNGNGTFTNPVVRADFPDPDVICVGDWYYMVTTTMHHFPGCTLLKSQDLVNWQYCANPLAKLSSYAEYNLEDGKDIYSKGSWACSLKYFDNKFHILFNAFGNADDGGGYMLTADDPEGSWIMTHLSRGYYDPGLLCDDDGTVYVVCGNTNLSVIQLDADFKPVKEVAVDGGFDGLEGSHFYKIGDYYYIYSVCCAWPCQQWCFRSKNVFGPYEKRKVFDYDDIHQGAMIQTQSGEWWTMLMRDCGAWGRIPYLLPLSWQDGWPVIGIDGKDAGTYTKPNTGFVSQPVMMPTTDNFRDYKLGMQWQWNHNPDNAHWSLTERPGWLRLYTAGTALNLKQARNSLTQRIFRSRDAEPSYGTVRMDVSNMSVGDRAGIAVFQDPYAELAVERTATGYTIGGQQVQIDSIVYLRAVVDFAAGKAAFYYSLDNIVYNKVTTELSMKYDLTVFVGNRFFIFNYARTEGNGYVDVDWFTTEKDFDEDTYYDERFVAYSADALTATAIAADATSYHLLLGSSRSFTLTATYQDGHAEDVTTDASYTVANDNIATIKNGRIMSNAEGETTVSVSYTDAMGNRLEQKIQVRVSLFPLTSDLFDPSIWTDGTFNPETGNLRTGQYGFGGWQYPNGVDLSSYKYLVVQLNRQQTCGASFRLFDENNYWSSASENDMGNKTQLLLDLHALKKADGKTLDPSHLYIIGFWSYGGGDISIKDVFVSNDGTTPAAILPVQADQDDDDWYTIQGTRVAAPAAKGVYILNGRKVVVAH